MPVLVKTESDLTVKKAPLYIPFLELLTNLKLCGDPYFVIHESQCTNLRLRSANSDPVNDVAKWNFNEIVVWMGRFHLQRAVCPCSPIEPHWKQTWRGHRKTWGDSWGATELSSVILRTSRFVSSSLDQKHLLDNLMKTFDSISEM